MTQSPPPTRDQIVDGDGFTSLSWLLFFNNQYNGDTGTVWTPTFTDLTISGTPTITGRYYRLSRRVVYFTIRIVPATSTTSVAGTTYVNNFPLTVTGDGVCFAVLGGIGDGPGHVVAGNNRIYTPAWTAVTVPVTVVGICEVQG